MSALWEELRPALIPAFAASAIGGGIGTTSFFLANGGPHFVAAIFVGVFVMPIGWLLSGSCALLLGLPVYMMMRSVGLRLHWWGSVLLGICVAATPVGYFMIHNWYALLEQRQNASWDWEGTLKWGGPFVLSGAAAGFTFWRTLPLGDAKA